MKVAQNSLIEEPFQAQVVRDAKVLEGISWSQSPLLLGFNSTKLKTYGRPSAGHRPVRHCLPPGGLVLDKTAAFTSDVKNRWASEWLRWTGFGRFWTQAVRTLDAPCRSRAFR